MSVTCTPRRLETVCEITNIDTPQQASALSFWPSMTTATKLEGTSRLHSLEVFGFLGLASLNIGVGRYWPDSFAASLVSYVFIGAMTIAFAVRVRAGYLRRKPYWTRDSWLRYAAARRHAAHRRIRGAFVQLRST